MQMTLREVLQVSVLKDATVVAGTSGLDNIVDSVTTIEVTEDSMVNWVYEKQLYISLKMRPAQFFVSGEPAFIT